MLANITPASFALTSARLAGLLAPLGGGLAAAAVAAAVVVAGLAPVGRGPLQDILAQ